MTSRPTPLIKPFSLCALAFAALAGSGCTLYFGDGGDEFDISEYGHGCCNLAYKEGFR